MTFKGETTIYGILRKKEKVFYLESIFGYDIKITPCPTIKKVLANKVGLELSLHGVAEWEFKTNNIVFFNAYNWDYHKSGNILKALKEIKKITNGYWDKFGTDQEINEALLKDKE